jgi:hypothetical protein
MSLYMLQWNYHSPGLYLWNVKMPNCGQKRKSLTCWSYIALHCAVWCSMWNGSMVQFRSAGIGCSWVARASRHWPSALSKSICTALQMHELLLLLACQNRTWTLLKYWYSMHIHTCWIRLVQRTWKKVQVQKDFHNWFIEVWFLFNIELSAFTTTAASKYCTVWMLSNHPTVSQWSTLECPYLCSIASLVEERKAASPEL